MTLANKKNLSRALMELGLGIAIMAAINAGPSMRMQAQVDPRVGVVTLAG